MWLAVLFAWSSLLPLAAPEGCPEASEDSSSWVRLKPLGHCRDGENTCPYRITLPPLTIQLPKPFRDLEKMARDLQSLTQMVNQLKADCRECKERQRIEWSLYTTDGKEDGGRIQASRGSINTKEREQDLHKGAKVVKGSPPKTEEEEFIIRGAKQTNTTGMEKQRWTTSREKNLNPSGIRYRDESSGGPEGSNPEHMERRTDGMSKVKEPGLFSAAENTEELQSSKRKQIESSLLENPDEQPTQASSSTVNTREKQQAIAKRMKVYQGTGQDTEEEDTVLIGSGAKEGSPVNMEKPRWSTIRERNLNQSRAGNKVVTSGGPKEPNPEHRESITDSRGKVAEPHLFSATEDKKEIQSPRAKQIESSLLGNQDEKQPTQASNGTVNTRDRQQGIAKRMKVYQGTGQETEEEDMVLIGSGAKEGSPVNMEKPRWSTIRERNLNQSRAGNKVVTSGGPKEPNPEHTESITDSRGKVAEPGLTTEDKEEVQSPRAKQTESSLLGNQDDKQPTQAPSGTVNTRERQDIAKRMQVGQGTTKETEEEDTVLSRTGTKEGSPVNMEKPRWSTIRERNLNQSRAGNKVVTSGGLKEPNPEHTESITDSRGKVAEPRLTTEDKEEVQSPRAKQTESSLLGNQDEKQPTQAPSGTVNTRDRQQDITNVMRVQVSQGTTEEPQEEDTVLIKSRIQQVSPTGMEKQRWSPIREGSLKPSSTGHTEDTSQKKNESTPVHTERTIGSTSKVIKPESLSSREKDKEPQSQRDKQVESSLLRNQHEKQTTQASSDTASTRERPQDVSKRVKTVQGTTQKTDEDTSSTRHGDEYDDRAKESDPAHMEKRTSGVRDVHSLTEPAESGKGLESPRAKQTGALVPGNKGMVQPTLASSNTRGGQEDIPKRVFQGTTQTKEGHTVLISSGTKHVNPTGDEKQSWNTSQVSKLDPSSTRRSGESNPVHIDRETEGMGKAREVHSLTSSAGNQDGEQFRHHVSQKPTTPKAGPGRNSTRTLTAQGKIENNPEIRGVTLAPENTAKTNQVNPPNEDKPIKRFMGLPRLTDTKEIKLNPNTDNRFENSSDVTQSSRVGDGTVKSGSKGGTSISMSPNERRPHITDSKVGGGSRWIRPDQDARLPDIVRDTPKTLDTKKLHPVTGNTAENNREFKLNVTELTKTILDWHGEEKEEVGETGDPTVTKEGGPSVVWHPVSEPNDRSGKGNVSRITDPQIQDTVLNSSRRAENEARVSSNPVTPDTQDEKISRPGRIRSSTSAGTDATTDLSNPNPQIQNGNSENLLNPGTHAESDTRTDSAPPNTVEPVTGSERARSPVSVTPDGTVDGSGTNPQRLHKNDALSEGQPKPDLKTTRPSSEENKAESQRKDMLGNSKSTSVRTGPLKQTPTAIDKSPVRSVSRPRTHAVGPNMRPRPTGLTSMRSHGVDPHPVNSSKFKERAKELNQPNLRLVKNITSSSTRVSPKQRRPYTLQRMPGNHSMETSLKVHSSGQVRNTSGLTEHMVDPRTRHIPSKTSSSPQKEFESSTGDMTQSVSPTVETHTTADTASAEKSNTAPTVEALNSPANHQIQTTPQNTETKLFHAVEPENPGGKRELDPITDSVREHGAERVMNQNIVSPDSNRKSGPRSHQAGVEKTESADSRKGANPFSARGVNSKQENRKFLRAGAVHNSTGKIQPTVEEVRTDRNELIHPATTATTYTTKPAIRDQQSHMTRPTTPVTTTPHFRGPDHVGKAKNTSGVKVSDTHSHPRLRNSSQELSKWLTGTRSDSDSRDKKQHLIIQRTGKVQGRSSTVTASTPNSVDRARSPKPVVMPKRVKSTARPRSSPPSTYSTPLAHHEMSKSVESSNGNHYPVAVDRPGESISKTTAENISKGNRARPLTNDMQDRDALENQLLSTCHGQCDPKPTLQPILDIRKPSENGREEPPQDCSDLLLKKLKSGVYSVTPAGSKNSTFRVFCDMEASGGGWTLIQNRFDGSISFNRSWVDYRRGFGNLTGEFWLGNDKIHWLTSAKAMVLRIELEDLDGVKEFAQYDRFHVANENQRYRLTIGGYTGTAGDALQFSKKFNHDQKDFSTPDRDNDRYPSGNCGAYYSSGWWFDACMAANLNGNYYQARYRGVRNGIFWGTWHNISTEYYPTNDRQAFKTVRMMVRPRIATDRDY